MDSKYCYPGTDVLINRFGIHDHAKLYVVERDITNARAMELAGNPIKGNYDLKHLQKIHKKLLGDIYPFAGKIRDVRIAKGNMFCYPEFIQPMADEIFTKLANEQHLKGLATGSFVERLSFYMGEVNALHPFREGNGRTQRVFFTQLAHEAGYKLHFEQMGKDELLHADIAGMAGDYSKLKALIGKHIEPLQKQSIRNKLDAAKVQSAAQPIKSHININKDFER
ncbi:Fic family protein (plasmid) [Oscillospiraceae bacterium PP1C4]